MGRPSSVSATVPRPEPLVPLDCESREGGTEKVGTTGAVVTVVTGVLAMGVLGTGLLPVAGRGAGPLGIGVPVIGVPELGVSKIEVLADGATGAGVDATAMAGLHWLEMLVSVPGSAGCLMISSLGMSVIALIPP